MGDRINESLSHPFELYFKREEGQVSVSSQGEVLCEALVDYIPIEAFQELFEKNLEAIRWVNAHKFIFDKRRLKAFHQPSMEWYCVTWKQKVYEGTGLKVHRKILPEEKWFQRAVEAGLEEIRQKNQDHPLDLLDIRYVGSIDAALRT